MSNTARAALIGGALAVFVVGFFVLRPGDDDTASTSGDATAQETPPAEATPTPAPEEPAAATPEATPTPRPEPTYTTIRAVGLQPVGGVKEIEVKKGGTIRLKVRSDQPDEAHLHGYDVSKPVGPGQTATYQVPANLEGIFELELENAAVPLAEITVTP